MKITIIARFKEWLKQKKIQRFNREFESYYYALLMGEMYDAKIKLLTDMEKNKPVYLKNYLEKGLSVSNQMLERIKHLSK